MANLGGGWTWMHKILARFSMGLLVEAGDGGRGAPVPSGCSRISLFIYSFTASAMWGKRQKTCTSQGGLEPSGAQAQAYTAPTTAFRLPHPPADRPSPSFPVFTGGGVHAEGALISTTAMHVASWLKLATAAGNGTENDQKMT